MWNPLRVVQNAHICTIKRQKNAFYYLINLGFSPVTIMSEISFTFKCNKIYFVVLLFHA
jgi:ribosomal protein S6